MKIKMAFALLCGLSAMRAADDFVTAVEHYATGILDTLKAVVTSGDALWKMLGDGQAVDTLQTVSTEAATLQINKERLRDAIVNHQSVQLSAEIERLKTAVRNIDKHLLKFATEIDAASGAIGGQLRIEVSRAETQKLDELEQVKGMVSDDAKVKQLDIAVNKLVLMRKGIKCLHDTIADRKAACDPDHVEKVSLGDAAK
jgi:hypothetical protein